MSKKLLSFFVILFLSISIPVTYASEVYCHVEGDSNLTPPIIHDQIIPNIVQEDLHLTDENSPYYVNSKIQIANGVTVTIDPGVEIRGNSVESFELFGNAKLIAKGTDLNKINFIITHDIVQKQLKVIAYHLNNSSVLVISSLMK